MQEGVVKVQIIFFIGALSGYRTEGATVGNFNVILGYQQHKMYSLIIMFSLELIQKL